MGLMGRESGIIMLKKALMMVLVVACYFNGVIKAEEWGLTPAQCHEERRILISACKPVLMRIPPSSFCCERVRVAHAGCVCPEITPKIAPLIDVNYAISVVQSCGRQVPRHYQCGSITTP
uniref:Bifunctional inhibitor/plant lipid transfer protein/seed storage helical domain-containing protein n=1 Tax=Opuntia streptacantha TaxID=393608 RepID=A0A7C9DM66_OPUST